MKGSKLFLGAAVFVVMSALLAVAQQDRTSPRMAMPFVQGVPAGSVGASGMYHGMMMHGPMHRHMAAMVVMGDVMSHVLDDMEGLSGEEFDSRFIREMTEHHQGAMDMAELALRNSNDTRIMEMAQEMITEQTSEIEMMRDIQGNISPGMNSTIATGREEGFRFMMSHLQNETLSHMSNLTGEGFDAVFLKEMIHHHASAVMMSELALENSEDPELRNLSERMIEDQTMEIGMMKVMEIMQGYSND